MSLSPSAGKTPDDTDNDILRIWHHQKWASERPRNTQTPFVVFFTTAKLFQANALMPQQCPVEH
jgi:hypothetical protein